MHCCSTIGSARHIYKSVGIYNASEYTRNWLLAEDQR